ncbi:Uncharacterised protein [Escherichia coli]|nr:Uncharacterised protein [Escherichia coli]
MISVVATFSTHSVSRNASVVRVALLSPKSFRFHFSGHQRLTIFVFELQSDGEGAKSFIVSAIIQPELVSTNISREPYRICIAYTDVTLILCPEWGRPR